MNFTHHDPGTSAARWRADRRWPVAGEPHEMWGDLTELVVVAAHPDDETLGAGGLIAEAVAHGVAVEVVVLTDGEGAHPNSSTTSRSELAAQRRDEVRSATDALGGSVEPGLWGLPDGGLHECTDHITRELVRLLGDARGTLLIAPWRRDGHRDHEAAGRAAAAAAVRTGARFLEYPVWMWHWADPEAAPWDRFVAIDLGERARARKSAAIAAHETQVRPLSDLPGDEVLLGPDFLAHFTGPQEVFIAEAASDAALDDLHAEDPDPWGVTHRWYEQRKRDLLLAALPRRRFSRGLELGCSRGDLARDLAQRCEEMVAVDRSPAAIEAASATPRDNLSLAVLDIPAEWPQGEFDLVVVSEVGYFLSPVAVEDLWERIEHSSGEHAVVMLCHWRHPIDGWVLDGPDVHASALRSGLPSLMARYVDDDVEILVLAAPELRPDPHE